MLYMYYLSYSGSLVKAKQTFHFEYFCGFWHYIKFNPIIRSKHTLHVSTHVCMRECFRFPKMCSICAILRSSFKSCWKMRAKMACDIPYNWHFSYILLLQWYVGCISNALKSVSPSFRAGKRLRSFCLTNEWTHKHENNLIFSK